MKSIPMLITVVLFVLALIAFIPPVGLVLGCNGSMWLVAALLSWRLEGVIASVLARLQ
jgi:hypothetical protein